MAEPQLRTPTRGDAEAIAELCNALSRDLYDSTDVDERAVGDWFGLSDLGMFVAEPEGRLLGYADVRRDDDGGQFPVDLRVHPHARGRGVADELLGAAELWAADRARPGAVMRGFAAERDSEAQGALADRGYRLIRHSFQMEIDLPGDPEPPDWPEGVSVRTFDRERDEQAVYECQQETFADHWDFHPIPIERWREFSFDSSFDPELWWLAESDGALAGICLNSWHSSGEPGFGWIGVLGVRRPWRRRGLGLALLRHSFADFRARGATRVGLGVDAENLTGAVRLYERAGMRPVRRNDTFEKAL
jgi:mycothiol synthase